MPDEVNQINSVAVLHFVNQGGDPDAEYLATGFSDSLIDSLSQIPKLRVKSLNAVSRYEGQNVDASKIGRELNVQAVLFVRMSQQVDALEISAELVAVSDNSRLWGAQYKRNPSDLLGLQQEIVGEIAEKLGLGGGTEKQPSTKQYTTNKEAYDAYLRGHVLLEKRTPSDTEKSIKYLEQAISIDPNYALAYADLGFAYMSFVPDRGVGTPRFFPKRRRRLRRHWRLTTRSPKRMPFWDTSRLPTWTGWGRTDCSDVPSSSTRTPRLLTASTYSI